MFESIYNTEALLLAVKLNQHLHREREKFPSASPPLPDTPWHPRAGGQTCGATQGHGAGRGWEAIWAWQERDSSEHPN